MRFGDSIYYAKVIKDENNRITGYEKPIEIKLKPNYFSLQPAKGFSNIKEFGTDIDKTYIAFAPYSIWGHTFSEDDKFYVDYTKPGDSEEEFGDNANTRADAVSYQNLFIRIVIKKLVATNEQYQY